MSDAPLPALDWKTLNLSDPYRVLIQASAGTGKTWTIGALYLRLLLEREVTVDKILVVTFTDAAAQELRQRLRTRLADAEQWLAGLVATDAADDSETRGWLKNRYPNTDTAKVALRRIRLARMDFDRAPIGTIHSFCQRVLRDFPLDAGAALGRDVRLDETALRRECVEDFWRRRYLDRDDVLPDEAEALFKAGPDALARDLASLLNHDAEVLPVDGLQAIDAMIASLREPPCVEQIQALCDVTLFKRSNSAARTRLIRIYDALSSGTNLLKTLQTGLDKSFEPNALDDQQRDTAKVRLCEHPLIRSLQSLRVLLKRRTIFIRGAVLREAFEYCRREIPLRAARLQGSTHSMLIDNVHGRVGNSREFAQRLFDAFPIALVDEFQDTDARQFAIFDRIYRDANGAKRGWLAMIGDPKQAIYGFRGGDVEAYLGARSSADAQFQLNTNYRSSEVLIKACNALYAKTDGGFNDARIRYSPVEPGKKAEKKVLARGGAPDATPLKIHLFRGDAVDKNGKQLASLGGLEALALDDCAARIVELLNDDAVTIGGEPLTAGKIAVLLPNNRQVAGMRGKLLARGVPCVGAGHGSVFESPVAAELHLFLHAVLNPDDAAAARGALATNLLGANLSDLLDWQNDARGFEAQLDRFARWHALAATRGAFGAIADMIEQRAADLLSLPDGERMLTDLRHLGELVAEREAREAGLEGVIAWFAAMRGEDKGMEEAGKAHRLRIESDAERVQLMTLHAAKGLEFPVVFLPLAWRISSRKGQYEPDVLRLHGEGGRLLADLGSANFDANLDRHFDEDLRERLRLLYVGMTRAESALHLYWVERKDAAGSAAWNIAGIDVLFWQAFCANGLLPDEESICANAAKLTGLEAVGACPMLDAEFRKPESDAAPLAARTPLPELRPFLWSHSFSGITRRSHDTSFDAAAADEVESNDEWPLLPDVAEAAQPELLALDAWRGRQFGDAVHALLEHAPAGPFAPADLVRQLAASGVRSAGDESSLTALTRMLDRSIAADLGGGLYLRDIAAADRVAEFGFQFPVGAALHDLRAVCAAHGFADIWPRDAAASVLRGMLVGFVDLIFLYDGRYHVLDYKTNRLGERLSEYRGAALDTAMAEHHYPLQALLYTVALHRYLRGRLRDYSPERHLGDSVYLFLRGVGLAPGAGVWRRRWPVALVEDIDAVFAGVELAA
ncbi:MAG: UvrD-helicase domain-containing protein [Proteobacteria bacterium]|nr:UvrD-helicase domain-containing protein [Pseudomonadota bacterium]